MTHAFLTDSRRLERDTAPLCGLPTTPATRPRPPSRSRSARSLSLVHTGDGDRCHGLQESVLASLGLRTSDAAVVHRRVSHSATTHIKTTRNTTQILTRYITQRTLNAAVRLRYTLGKTHDQVIQVLPLEVATSLDMQVRNQDVVGSRTPPPFLLLERRVLKWGLLESLLVPALRCFALACILFPVFAHRFTPGTAHPSLASADLACSAGGRRAWRWQ